MNIKQQNKSNSRKSGFSLVEMLVAIGIFMSIMTLAISSLISIIDANKKVQSTKSTVDSVTFAMEYISRTMRMGTDYRCSTDGSNFQYNCLGGGKAVKFNYPSNVICDHPLKSVSSVF